MQKVELYKFETSDCKNVNCIPCTIDYMGLAKYFLRDGAVVGNWEINKVFITHEGVYMYTYTPDVNFFYKKIMFWLSEKIMKHQALLDDYEDKYNFIKAKMSVKLYAKGVE